MTEKLETEIEGILINGVDIIKKQGFVTAFPDLAVEMDRLTVNGTKTEYHWTLTGTNTGTVVQENLSGSAALRNGVLVPTGLSPSR